MIMIFVYYCSVRVDFLEIYIETEINETLLLNSWGIKFVVKKREHKFCLSRHKNQQL